MSTVSKKEDEDNIIIDLGDGEDPITFPKEFWEVQTLTDPVYTGYPEAKRHYEIVVDKQNSTLENYYYWAYRQITIDWSHDVEKIIDTHAGSMASTQFGHMQSRLSIQQNQISQYLKGISEMIKGLFQIVREVRVIDDRLQYYYDSYNEESGNKDSSEMVLKDLWVSQVEGGTKNPGSVYGLAANVGFTILPDIFFRYRIPDPKNIDKRVDKLELNEKIKEVLKRKLRQYHEWKTRTFKELKNRRNYMVKYLRQHYNTIKLYISWIKPNLKYVRQFQQSKNLENNPELLNSFESNMIEVEMLAKKKAKGDYYSVAVLTLVFRTRPELGFHTKDYSQKGPVHYGKLHLYVRSYTWNKRQIEAYKKFRDDEDFELIAGIDETIKEAMDALGDELKGYLEDAGESFEKKVEKVENIKKKSSFNLLGPLDPFISVFKGFGEIFGLFMPNLKDVLGDYKTKKNDKFEKWKNKNDKSDSGKDADMIAWLIFKNFKKAHGMMTWW